MEFNICWKRLFVFFNPLITWTQDFRDERDREGSASNESDIE